MCSIATCPSFGNWFRPRSSFAVRKAIVRAFSPPSSPTSKTPMRTAANLPIVKFSGGEDEVCGGFLAGTSRVSAAELLAGGAVNGGSPKVGWDGPPTGITVPQKVEVRAGRIMRKGPAKTGAASACGLRLLLHRAGAVRPTDALFL